MRRALFVACILLTIAGAAFTGMSVVPLLGGRGCIPSAISLALTLLAWASTGCLYHPEDWSRDNDRRKK